MKILMATNGTPESEHAIQVACTLLPVTSAEVILVSVTDAELRVGANEDTTKDFACARTVLSKHGTQASSEVVRRGHFGEEIVAVAKDLQVDVIVLGSGSRGRLALLAGGSTADDVLRGWLGATLIVRHPG